MSTTNGKLGRNPLFTPAKAREILKDRIDFGKERITIAQFIDQLVAAGTLEFPCSVATMQRLLSGKLMPSLRAVDAEGKETAEFYDYSKVPTPLRGRAPREERVDRETGAVLPVFTKRQKQWEEKIMKDVENKVNIIAAHAVRQQLGALREEFGAVLISVERIEAFVNQRLGDSK